MAIATDRRPGIRSDTLTTKRATLRAFAGEGSAQVIAAAVAVVLVARVLVGGWAWADLVMVGVTIVLVGPVEWVIHVYLLHADDSSWASRTLGTGVGHREHHLDPPAIEWLLLGGSAAGQYVVAIAMFTAGWSVSAAWVFGLVVDGGSLVGAMLTALLAAYLALGHYEWTHLLVHTRYRPQTRYYARLARNHRLHHFRNEGYWLGVTTNTGDRLMRTLPRDRSDVPLSPTARTLAGS